MEEAHGAPPARAPEKVAAAKAFCEELLARLGAQVDVAARETAEAIGLSLVARPGNPVELPPPLVEAIQTLANRVANPRAEGRKWVNVEVGGFAEEGDPVVKAMADRLAATVRRTGRAVAIAPISPRERRQIHLALVPAEGVATQSEGEGIFRQLVIYADPRKRGGAPQDP